MAKITLVFEHRTNDFLTNILENYDEFFQKLQPDNMIVETKKTTTNTRVKYK